MKKLTALLLATSLSVTLFGCKDKNKNDGTQQTNEDDGLVSVWLVTSETSYEADGSKGFSHRSYTYNEKGMPLTESHDNGPIDQQWNESLGIWEQTFLPFDGNVESFINYYYTDQGDLLYYEDTRKTFDKEGNETSSNHQAYGKDQYVYHYDDQGRIQSVDIYGLTAPDVVGDEITSTAHFCYDESGNLFEIYYEHVVQDGMIQWAYDFRYDDSGRLICSSTRPREGVYFYEYDYNDQGKLSGVRQYRTIPNSPLDDRHFSQADYAPEFTGKPDPQMTVQLTYDSQGRLVSRTGMNDAQCTYDSEGCLQTVTYADGKKYVYVDSEQEATGDAIYLIRDEHGNVVKEMTSDGACTVYTYQEFRLSAEDAARCNAVKQANARVDIVGVRVSSWLEYKGSLGFIPYLPVPENELLFTDTLRN